MTHVCAYCGLEIGERDVDWVYDALRSDFYHIECLSALEVREREEGRLSGHRVPMGLEP